MHDYRSTKLFFLALIFLAVLVSASVFLARYYRVTESTVDTTAVLALIEDSRVARSNIYALEFDVWYISEPTTCDTVSSCDVSFTSGVANITLLNTTTVVGHLVMMCQTLISLVEGSPFANFNLCDTVVTLDGSHGLEAGSIMANSEYDSTTIIDHTQVFEAWAITGGTGAYKLAIGGDFAMPYDEDRAMLTLLMNVTTFVP